VRLYANQLQGRLQQQFDPIYLISGDEPLQQMEGCDRIRRAATAAGYSERITLDTESGFQWEHLHAEAEARSLFADRRLIDLRLSAATIGTEGSKALCHYCERLPQDTLLLITLPKLDSRQLKSKWIMAIDSVGLIVQIWSIEGPRLLSWLDQRMREQGLLPEQGVVQILADQVEGNLLAAKQEIEKLLLLNGPGVISVEDLSEAVSDSARFDVYNLVDKALVRDASRCLHILARLRAEGVAEPIVNWALARELRLLYKIHQLHAQGSPINRAMTQCGVWEKRKPLISKALNHLRKSDLERLLKLCRQADMATKGMIKPDNSWLLFEQIILGLAGVRLSLCA
jgi:DNA polymerase-3 subunit delta